MCLDDAMAAQGMIDRSYAAACDRLLEELQLSDPKLFMDLRCQVKQLRSGLTAKTLGYIARNQPFIMQADIVSRLTEGLEGEKPSAVRQDIKRRSETLKAFGLVNREALTRTAVQLSLTEHGRSFYAYMNECFRLELLNAKKNGGQYNVAA